MKKAMLTLTILVAVIVSYSQEIKGNVAGFETEIINDLFLDLIIEGESEIPVLPNFILKKNENDSTDLLTSLDVIIQDSLKNISDFLSSEQIKTLVNDSSLKNHLAIIRLLINNSVEKKIFVNEITKVGNYKLLVTRSKITNRSSVKGVLRMSNIVYNYEKNMGCFYYEFICGGECGNGSLAFFSLLDNRWCLVEDYLIWVS